MFISKQSKWGNNLLRSSDMLSLFYPTVSRSSPQSFETTISSNNSDFYKSNAEHLRIIIIGRPNKYDLRFLLLLVQILDNIPSSLSFVNLWGRTHFVKSALIALGAPVNRLNCYERLPTSDYIKLIQSSDVCLGTYPEEGGMTTLDSLSNGLPYLQLDTHSSTATSRAILSSTGNSWMIFSSEDSLLNRLDFIRKNLSLFRSPEYRYSLQQSLFNSSAGNPQLFTRNLCGFFLVTCS